MSTTRLFVEQVIIGFLLVALGVLFVRQGDFDGLNSMSDIGVAKGAVAVIGIYLAGLVYDRIADTLTNNVEAINRIVFGLAKRNDRPDRFPSDRINLDIMKEAALFDDHLAYLRHRIRITRALTTLVPAYGVVVCLAIAGPRNWTLYGMLLALLYAVVLVAKIGGFPAGPIKSYSFNTDKDLAAYLASRQSTGFTASDIVVDAAWWGLGASLVLDGMILAHNQDSITVFAVPLAVLLSTLLAGWVWWRISATQVRLQRLFFDSQAQAPKQGSRSGNRTNKKTKAGKKQQGRNK